MEKDYIRRDNTHKREIHMEGRDLQTNGKEFHAKEDHIKGHRLRRRCN